LSISGIYQFGTLTTKSGKVINFDEIARDNDGKISRQQYLFIQKELGLDTVEFLEESQKGEKNVTPEEFAKWYQEGEMQKMFDNLCTQIATDFIGDNARYSKQVLKELRIFLADFKEEYLKGEKSLAELSADFKEALPVKYAEIKKEVLGGTSDNDKKSIQEKWEKYQKEFESDLADARSIKEFVELNREYINKHGEYLKAMLNSGELSEPEKTSLLNDRTTDLNNAKYYTELLGKSSAMQSATAHFINMLTENCKGWEDLKNNPIISEPDIYMLEYFYSYRDNPDPSKKDLVTEYRKMLDLQYSILQAKYEKLVEQGEINPDKDIDLKDTGDENS